MGEGESPAHAPLYPYRLGINGTVWGFGLRLFPFATSVNETGGGGGGGLELRKSVPIFEKI